MPNPKPPMGGLDKKVGGLKGKWWLVGGGGILAVGAYMYYARNSAAASTATTAATSATDPTIDPSTGVPYSQEAAGYNAYGDYSGYSGGGGSYVGATPVTTSPGTNADGTVNLNPADESALTGISSGIQSTDDVISALAGSIPHQGTTETNQQWAHAAEAKLESEGLSKHAAIAAIGAYLAGLPLTKTQETHVQTAIGHVGAPPTPAPRAHLVVPKKPAKKPAKKTTHKTKARI